MTDPRCGCCEGTRALTPLPTANRPGLSALSYLAGTHATFLETMLARLTSHALEDGSRPLQRLTTRATDDPAIALLDAWATVADVLTFYQERIANEGYLLTATERRSVLELARLVGYGLRPGVAASVYLAFTLERDQQVEIPAGTRAQSIPEPGGLPQIFETEEALPARTEWNQIRARRTRPHLLRPDERFEGTRRFRLAGTASNLRSNDAVLFVCGSIVRPYTVRSVEPDAGANVTVVTYAPFGIAGSPAPQPQPQPQPSAVAARRPPNGVAPPPLGRLAEVVRALAKKPSLPPASRLRLTRPPDRVYNAAADLGPQLLVRFNPRLEGTLYAALAGAAVTAEPPGLCHVEALRVKAAPFGHNAPPRLVVRVGAEPVPGADWNLDEFGGDEGDESDAALRTISLDAVYDGIKPGSRVVIRRADRPGDVPDPFITRVEQVSTVSRADYGMSAKVTELLLADPWLSDADRNRDLGLIRGSTVYAQSEELEPADEVIEDDVAGDTIELGGLYDGLEAGRWLFIQGVRADVPGVEGEDEEDGVEASELVMLAGIEHGVHTFIDAQGEERELPTDTLHTRLILAEPLAYSYRRDTVKIQANVVRATHGEKREEVLGSGDATRPFQQFALKQRPLTYVSAATPSGVASTLEVRVDEVRWPEREALLYLDPPDRGYVTAADDDGNTTITFGDGRHGARLPTGIENVTAVYRSGIGKTGNAAAGQISVLASRPLGVKEVVNPQRASGGADPESRDQARRNAPLAVLALDRLVSVQDYADFARTFAGIGKAAAAALSDGRREIVHLTIAGADDAPIDESSDLHRNLLLALSRFGDPRVPLRVAPREALFLFIRARVKLLEDHVWSAVEPKLRAALLDAFGFDRRELGESVLLSQVIGAMHAVDGVDYADIDLFDAVSEGEASDPAALAARLEALAAAAAPAPPGTPGNRPKQRLPARPARVDPAAADPAQRIRPAQLAYLSPDLPDTLILTEVQS